MQRRDVPPSYDASLTMVAPLPHVSFFDVLTGGQLRPGHERDDVVSALVREFGLDTAEAEELLEPGQVVVKAGVDEQTSRTFVAAFRHCGLHAWAAPAEAGNIAGPVSFEWREQPGRAVTSSEDAWRVQPSVETGSYQPPAERIRQQQIRDVLPQPVREPARLVYEPVQTRLITMPGWLSFFLKVFAVLLAMSSTVLIRNAVRCGARAATQAAEDAAAAPRE